MYGTMIMHKLWRFLNNTCTDLYVATQKGKLSLTLRMGRWGQVNPPKEQRINETAPHPCKDSVILPYISIEFNNI